jgi:hypothetical protein
MWKKIGLAVLYLLIGCLLGSFLSMAYMGYKVATAMFMLQEKEIFQMEEAAVRAYYTEPNEVAVWALENQINILNKLKEERSQADVNQPYFFYWPDQSLALLHARLGQLYNKMNNSEKSNYHFDQALYYSKRALRNVNTREDLLKLVTKIDESVDANFK